MRKTIFLSFVLFVFLGLFCSCSKENRNKIFRTEDQTKKKEQVPQRKYTQQLAIPPEIWEKWQEFKKTQTGDSSLVMENGVWYIVTHDNKRIRIL
jgi:hypothetical protein